MNINSDQFRNLAGRICTIDKLFRKMSENDLENICGEVKFTK